MSCYICICRAGKCILRTIDLINDYTLGHSTDDSIAHITKGGDLTVWTQAELSQQGRIIQS